MKEEGTPQDIQSCFPVEEDSYIMDTPGFSSLYVGDFEKEELKYYFPEFASYEGSCRFHGCDHIHEPGCAVKQAVEEGKIHPVQISELYRILSGTERTEGGIKGMEYILAPSILAADFKNLGSADEKDGRTWSTLSAF